jgi:hypothetical protein
VILNTGIDVHNSGQHPDEVIRSHIALVAQIVLLQSFMPALQKIVGIDFRKALLKRKESEV